VSLINGWGLIHGWGLKDYLVFVLLVVAAVLAAKWVGDKVPAVGRVTGRM